MAYTPLNNFGPPPVSAPGGFGGGYAATTTGTGGGGFNINPGTQTGSGPFGAVPGPIGAISPAQVAQPQDPFKQLSALYPNLSGANAGASDFIGSELSGQLSPGTIRALTNLSAERGISSGMGPGSGLWNNALLGNVAGATEALQQHGVADFNSFLPMMANTETITPQLQTNINTSNANLSQQAIMANLATAERNATMAAAPNPAAAQNYAQQLFDKYLGSMGPGGGTGTWSKGPWTPAQRPSPGVVGGPMATGLFSPTDATQGGYGPAYTDSGAWDGSNSGGAMSLSGTEDYLSGGGADNFDDLGGF